MIPNPLGVAVLAHVFIRLLGFDPAVAQHLFTLEGHHDLLAAIAPILGVVRVPVLKRLFEANVPVLTGTQLDAVSLDSLSLSFLDWLRHGARLPSTRSLKTKYCAKPGLRVGPPE